MCAAATEPTTLELLAQRFPQKVRLNTKEIASVIGWHPESIRNAVRFGRFPIHTYIDGKHRYADIRDIAAHQDKLRNKAGVGRPTKASIIEARAQ